jgi:Rad3-related DNA helicase
MHLFRSDPKYLTSLGQSVINIIRLVPHGVLIFFPSYRSLLLLFCLVLTLVERWDLQSL